MKRHKKKPKLPVQGAAFAVPLGDGRFSICRVLLDARRERSEPWNRDTILVAGSAWIGDEVPRAEDSALRPILYLTHHSWNNKPNILWVSEEPPEDFVPIGNIKPTTDEQGMPCTSFSSWASFRIQPIAQWKWNNQRDAVLAEDVIKLGEDAKARLKVQRQREQFLRQITLDELRAHRFFSNWQDFPPPQAIRASQKVMNDTVDELLELGPRASEKERMAVLQKCIESFNELDSEMRFIETGEREDICEEFEAIVHACGLGSQKDLADNWRDW